MSSQRPRSETTASLGLPFELEPENQVENTYSDQTGSDVKATVRNNDGGNSPDRPSRRSATNSVDILHLGSSSMKRNSPQSPSMPGKNDLVESPNSYATSPSLLSDPSTSPSSSYGYFQFSPAQGSSSGGGYGGRNRSISVATMATSFGGSLGYAEEGDGGVLAGFDDVGGWKGKGKEVVRDEMQVLPSVSGLPVAEVPESVEKGEEGEDADTESDHPLCGDGTSGLSEHDSALGDATVPPSEGLASTALERITPRPHHLAAVSTDAVPPAVDLVRSVPGEEPPGPQPLAPEDVSNGAPASLVAPAPRHARPRAQSIARSLVGSSSIPSGRESPSPSPASSIRNGKFGAFRGKLQRSRSSFLSGLGMEPVDASRSDNNSRPPTPDVAYDTSNGEGSRGVDKGKGKVKGFVKRYMGRARSSLSVPVLDVEGTAGAHASRDDPVAIRETSGQSPRPRSKSLDGPAALLAASQDGYLPPIPVVASPDSQVSSWPSSSQTVICPQTNASSPGAKSTTCWFDNVLPRELQLRVFQTLIDLHIEDHEKDLAIGRFKGNRARTKRWVGEEAGRRELIKLSRVSRRWRALSFDGQMWAQMDLHQFLDHISPSVAIHILFSVATFLNALDLRGWDLLPDIAVRRSLAMPGWNMRLQRIDLRFCSQLTRATLEGILDHSPRLRHINFRGLDSVDWSLIMLINKKCPGITFLDASFCGGERLEHEDISLDGQWRSLKSLKLAGGMVGPGALGGIGRCMPNLEVLDLSYSQYIDDDELLDFVKISPDMAATAWGTNDSLHIAPKIVRLRPSQAGLPRTAAEEHGLVYRRITHLKHLSLSRCPLVTDQGCHYLAHAVPDLELLEVAYAGARLHDDGMIGLLGSCPKIRKIDLEGAADITDRLIAALTPPKPGSTRPGNVAGQQLESLSIGFAVAVTTDAVLRLLRHCPKLSYLGLDNTSISDSVIKEFIRRRGGVVATSTINVVDCRSVSRNVVEVFERQTRPRRGWRGWQSVPFNYQDGPRPKYGRDECADLPVVQSFWTWNKVARTPASLAMSGDSLTADSDGRPGEVSVGIMTSDERSCIIM